MALSFRKNSARGSVGLDIDGDFLAAVQMEGGRIVAAASAELAPGVVTDGEVTDKEGLATALRDFFKHNGLPKTVRVGIANQQIVVRQIELPLIEDKKELAAAVRFQAAEAIAMPLDEAVLDYQVASRSEGGEGGTRLHVVVVAARRAMVDGLVEPIRSAGLRAEGIDLDAFALVRTLAHGAPPGAARVYCHLAGVTNLAIALGPACLFTRTLSAHGDGEDEEATATVLADEIRLSIDYYMAQPGAGPVSELVLSGPGASRRSLAGALGSKLGLDVAAPAALGALEPSSLPDGEDPYRHTVSAGLALGATA